MTRSQLRKEIKDAMETGLSHLQAMEAVCNEFEMYSDVIQDIVIKMIVADAA